MDRAEFDALYLALFERLCRFAAAITGSIHTAQEIVQDVFLTIWSRRDAIDIRGDQEVYLYTAVRNRARKVGRHDRVIHRLETAVSEFGGAPPALGTPEPSPDKVFNASELRRAVERALADVRGEEREAIFLRWEEGRTYDEIGKILGISSMGAHKMVSRTAMKVRDILASLQIDGTGV